MARPLPKPHAASARRTVRAPDASLPAVLGNLSSTSRLKSAANEHESGSEAIADSLAAALQDLDGLEFALPSSPGLDSLAPPLPRTISLAPLADELEPEQRNTYRIRGMLGVGGMATVYDAIKEGSGGFRKRVALKRIHDHLAYDPRIVELLVDEARLASLIDHPNVCQVLDFGVDVSGHFMALEYLDGFTLRAVLATLELDRHRLAEPRHPWIVARIVAGVAEGLHAAHELRDELGEPLEVIHRDVTPHNLFVLRSGGVKVADFGVARARNQLHHTVTGALKGKLAYSSPEQLQRRKLDRRTDIFSLGVVMWELLTGERLFEADSEAETIARIVEPAPDVRERQPSVLPAIASIVRKALAVDPAERYGTARELARALEQVLAQQTNHVSVSDLGDWLLEVMGTPSQPRLPREASNELIEATQSVGTGEVELGARSAPKVPPLPGSSLSHAVPPLPSLAPPERARPITALARVEGPAPVSASPPAAATKPVGRWIVAVAAMLGVGALSAAALLTRQPTRAFAPRAIPVAVQASPPLPAKTPATLPSAAAMPPSATAAPSTGATIGLSPSVTARATAASDAPSLEPAPTPPRAASASTTAPALAAPASPALQRFGSVMVTVSGGSANVLVDGQNYGLAPQRVTLPPGAHTIALSRPGRGASNAVSVSITPGTSSFVTLPLAHE